jgi:hypothetical protein
MIIKILLMVSLLTSCSTLKRSVTTGALAGGFVGGAGGRNILSRQSISR